MIRLNQRQQQIVAIISQQEQANIAQIKELLLEDISQVTLNRELAKLMQNQVLHRIGKGRSTTYVLSGFFRLFQPIDMENYFKNDIDHRTVLTSFQFSILDTLLEASLFTEVEQEQLKQLKIQYQKNIANLSETLYKKELERLSIELSWKSAQIEGNTYSLLETERLFLEKQEADNKTKEEATMLLNHKDALQFMLAHEKEKKPITLRFIEEIHSILIKDLGVSKNIRSRIVGITGTNYHPLDNKFQIQESLQRMCDIINAKGNSFEKALIALVLISYIQPFEDGNKRTARMISNALLIADNACPLSYRSVDVLTYKKAMLLFYEQNNLSAFKELFIEQNVFAVTNYFR